MLTNFEPKLARVAQNFLSHSTKRTSTLSMRRCLPFRFSSALACSDSSGRMKLSASVWLTTIRPASIAKGSDGRAVLPEQELEHVDGHVGADLDLTDEVLADDTAGEEAVGELVESVLFGSVTVHPPRHVGGDVDVDRLAEPDAGRGVEHLECGSRTGDQVLGDLHGDDPALVDGRVDGLGLGVVAVAADDAGHAASCPGSAPAARRTRG